MKSLCKHYLLIACLCLSLSGLALAQTPQLINYQALLTDPATGQPVADGTYEIVFSIYDVASGGTAVWTETQNVQTQNGLYSVLLGSITPLTPAILSGPEKYLGIKVGSDPEMMPRKRIVSVAYAIVSGTADSLDGIAASEYATKTELSTSDGDPPNQGSNQVSWDNLKEVPPGFADGVDDVNGGGGNTLDQAYDQGGAGAGRIITADAGAVNVAGPDGLTVNGNVGIGTTSPQSMLHVEAGEIRVTNDNGNQLQLVTSSQEWHLDVTEGTNDFQLRNMTADTRPLVVTASGKVGIGTMSPAEKLDVAGTVRMAGFKMTTAPAAGHVLTSDASGVGTWQPPSATNAWSLTGNSGTTPGTHFLGTTDNQALVVKTNGAERMRINSDGNIGIGIINPSHKIDVNGTIRIKSSEFVEGIHFVDTDFTIGDHSYPGGPDIFELKGGGMRIFEVSGTTDFFFDNVDVYPDNDNAQSLGLSTNRWASLHAGNGFFTGNVGIGTTSPSSPLEVAGAIHSSSEGFKFPDGSLQTTAANVGFVPVGAVVAWSKTFPNTPPLSPEFLECNGQLVDDPESPFNGQSLPDLNTTNRFLRGSTSSGAVGGSENHNHLVNMPGGGSIQLYIINNGVKHNFDTETSEHLPPYYEVVWIMRIK